MRLQQLVYDAQTDRAAAGRSLDPTRLHPPLRTGGMIELLQHVSPALTAAKTLETNLTP